ncbi:proline--tRNA ligase 2 [Clostridia bacterium]|nr:proline--tRNA ligase 2 [Clostridia bacterium]
MEGEKKQVERITAREEDFAQWYTDVVTKAELIHYSSVKGCVILRPDGYAIWENIQRNLDRLFKETGVENVSLPLLIPEHLLQKEKDHVEGFAPEVAWVTLGGEETLSERLCIRPTSETLFCDFYADIIQSYRELPKLYNQWCSVVRWEKTTRPFLRSTEFLWQEGHTAHATEEEARERTLQMLNLYADFCEEYLAIPVIKGEKTQKEKFAGAKSTYTIEALMHDGKALQSATSHLFGDGFAKAFSIRYSDKNNVLQYVHQTSWGLSTRIIGALIMVHGDDSGLILPPKIAPIQIMLIPIQTKKEGIVVKLQEWENQLSKVFRVKADYSDKSPGWKFNEQEMRGIPLRLELGPRDLQNQQMTAVRRDTGEKISIPFSHLEQKVKELLDDIQDSLLQKANKHLENHIYEAKSYEEFKQLIASKPGIVKMMWCEQENCEKQIKEETGASSRCIPFQQESLGEKCPVCHQAAKKMVYWGKAY